MMNILHITDLHIDNFKGDEEFLREGFYREYIDRLFTSVQKFDDTINIDYLIVTGDFINIGKIENYRFAKKILEYLCDKFEIIKENVCLSIGNHDYKWKELNNDMTNEVKLKEPFKEFCSEFNSDYIENKDYFFLRKLEKNVYYLSIDSLWKSNNGNPGKFTQIEEDKLVNTVIDNIDENDSLLIGSHFPIVSFDNNFLAGEEADFHNKHIWISGNSLRDRINKIKIKNKIWFHGDIHASDQKIQENDLYITTSKFGGKPDISEQKKQAVIISIDDDNISKIISNYEFPTHKQTQNLGNWVCLQRQELREITSSTVKQIKTNNDFNAYSEDVEREILRIIEKNNLYKFGRFHTSDKYISLGWVDIHSLMNDKELLNRISDKSYDIIKDKINLLDSMFFIGVEIIGGILASQLSVRFNVKNSIIPIEQKRQHYSEFELSHSSSYDNTINKMKNVVVFIDLISSGKTINKIVQEIKSKNENINIHVISIITNDIENKVISIPNTELYTSFCVNLKIPIIKHDQMPEEKYLTPNLKY